ncbi:hypothetical protein N836_28870 [Leptolyngbya sp. Heron Island J]|nr:hypothetical protein N836_28870 [Leptolyngbya sp. Heron Island J]
MFFTISQGRYFGSTLSLENGYDWLDVLKMVTTSTIGA